MKFDQARTELKKILNEQQTVRTSKLKIVLESMNVSLKKRPQHQRDVQIEFLNEELKKRNREITNLQKVVAKQKRQIESYKNELKGD